MATSEGGEDSVARYLHDFTQMVYEPKDDAETEVIDSATFLLLVLRLNSIDG